jgi:hypothetical protein
MITSLATFILLSGHLFSSSASLLNITKQFPEKLSTIKFLNASPIATASTSLSTIGLTSLTGYFSNGIYSDLSCKTPFLVEFTALNACYPTGESNTYESVTTNTTYVITSVYSDSLCKFFVKRVVESFSDGVCVYGRKASISTTSTLTTDVAALTER